MKKKILFSIFALAVSAGILQVGSVFADGEEGNAPSQSLAPLAPQVFGPINPRLTFSKAAHVANGVALMNRTSGWIHLRGVPKNSRVVRAILYWTFLDSVQTGPAFSPVLFNGNRVNGAKAADSNGGDWSDVTRAHTYRANVTGFIPNTNPNQDYEVIPVFNMATKTTGYNEAQLKRLEGATLVVIYTNASLGDSNNVFIYDTSNEMEFSTGGATFTLNHPTLSGLGLFTMCGADGQRGTTGYDNALANETGTFDGTQISGPSVAPSDWDGSAGLPLPQCWDVHSHLVTLSGTSSVVTYTPAPTPDRLVPVIFVLQRGFDN